MNLKTRIRSTVMRRLSSAAYLEKQRLRARKNRIRQGDSPVVHYFHQVEDPYSHLAVQKLEELKARYRIAFQPHLVSRSDPVYQGDAAHFDHWARRDAISVADDYRTVFSPDIEVPSADHIAAANQVLAAVLESDNFAFEAFQIGETLWAGKQTDAASANDAATQVIAAGNALRQQLGHYQGAMFYFEGEWFWGIDRIRLLEQRLIDEGFDQHPGPLCVPEPMPEEAEGRNPDGILLEYFPSLRSPYTAIGHQRVLQLVERSGVTVQVRPVMPMMMRGIPAPRAKQRYIITDAGREAREHGIPFGRIIDPFGEPVKKAFALYPAADALGHGMHFVTAYLNAAWFDGIDIATERGLKEVVRNAGLDWHDLNERSRGEDWEAVLSDNLSTLNMENLWGVPSFRVSGGSSDVPYACWGQDRIWRVANEIARRASNATRT